ncbi:SseB family protein [Actinomadura sp. NBRC 104425]|uniref:SseB family protein n=1 Tax=Actinomadura sp. NBRC 104425 TaxID=3032204 RepID=UPI0025562A1A|nr:SseB family protein [Actinomadura sp. NBRC 104425]
MLEWSEFARRLGRELAVLERDTILIVRERDESRHYVQAMREPDRLYAEAVSNNFLDGPLLLTLADEEVLSEAGWRPPEDPAPRNWWTELPAFAALDDHARLSDMMVTALRDVQGVRRPSDLVYESFHRLGTGQIELPDFGIEAASPGQLTRRRSSAEALAQGGFGPGRPPAPREPLDGLVGRDIAVPPTEPKGLTGPEGPTPPLSGGAGPSAAAGGGVDLAQRIGPAPLGAPVPDAEPGPSAGRTPPWPTVGPDELESRLADAKQRGDHTTYFELLLSAELVLPVSAAHPRAAGFPTTTLGTRTYITVFTSPQSLARSIGRPGDPPSSLYRPTSFAQLAAEWPDPAWQLAVNPGLPSEVHLDAAAVARLDAQQRAQGRHTAPRPAVSETPAGPPAEPSTETPSAPPSAPAPASAADGPAPDAPTAPAPSQGPVAPPSSPAPASAAEPSAPPPAGPGPIVLRPPHGARLWHWAGEGEERPVAVYDAIGGVWTPVRSGPGTGADGAGAPPAPRSE